MYRIFIVFSLIGIGCGQKKETAGLTLAPHFAELVMRAKLADHSLSGDSLGDKATLVFADSEKEGIIKYEYRYIGLIVNKALDTLRFSKMTTFSGGSEQTLHALSYLYVHKKDGELIGQYGLFLPSYIYSTEKALVFKDPPDRSSSLSCIDSTIVDFTDSIPSMFFLRCKEDLGDLIEFDQYTDIDKQPHNVSGL